MILYYLYMTNIAILVYNPYKFYIFNNYINILILWSEKSSLNREKHSIKPSNSKIIYIINYVPNNK
ncbi:Uncharacterised protein [Parabacteroides distasonis]|nr:Uncharacterised protein [Parabacteroides distasonis]